MDQVKIGKFIAESRKNVNLTQAQLAERLGITDRAVSKWERGKAMPDSSIMLELCDVLGITVNELLCGEKVSMENYNKELESNLLEMVKEKQSADKRLLTMEWVAAVLCLIPLLGAAVITLAVPLSEAVATPILLVSLLPLLFATPFMIRIEQTAGYYVCAHCGHKYIPAYKNVFIAIHMGRTRYMRCPECGRRSWQKKVLSKD